MITIKYLFDVYSPSARGHIKAFKKKGDYMGISNVMSREGSRVFGFAVGANPSMVSDKAKNRMMKFGNAATGGATKMLTRSRKRLSPKDFKPYIGIERRKAKMPRITKNAA